MNTQKLLATVIGLQVLSLAAQFLGQPTVIAPAQAQMPDAGGQRSVMIDELKGIRAELKTLNTATASTSGRVDKIVALLDGGKLQVRTATPDENKWTNAGR
jgi:hypothetical protein